MSALSITNKCKIVNTFGKQKKARKSKKKLAVLVRQKNLAKKGFFKCDK